MSKSVSDNDLNRLKKAMKRKDLLALIDKWWKSIKAAQPATTTPTPKPTPSPAPIPTPAPAPSAITWSSGVFAAHAAAQASKFATFRGRSLGHVAVFASRGEDDKKTPMTNYWWLDSVRVPAGVPAVSVGLPLYYKGRDLTQDLTSEYQQAASVMAATGKTFYARLAWEFNLPNEYGRLTDANRAQWVTRFNTYTQILKDRLGSKVVIVLNWNGDRHQSGYTGSLADLIRSLPLVEAIGPDAYDCWPGGNTPAALAQQFAKPNGLNESAALARQLGKKLVVPEWAATSGTQWKDHQGGDNAAYVAAMRKYFGDNADILLFESYFNEPDPYLKSDLMTQLPNAAAAYKSGWRA